MRLTLTLLVIALLLAPSLAQADIPQFMSYQGVLRDASGSAVPDGSYSVEFSLYGVASGGTALWTETHGLSASGGIIEASLGTIVPLDGLPFDVPYWLGISVEGQPELTPRTALASVPYAEYAGTATHCVEGDDDWTIDGSDVYHDVGKVGIGTDAPEAGLHVVTGSEPCAVFRGGGSDWNYKFAVTAANSLGTAGAFFSGGFPPSGPLTPAAVYGSGRGSARGAHFGSDNNDAVFAASSIGRGIWARSSNNYAGYFDGGGLGVYVDDQFETNAFRMAPGASSGYVLTSDVDGIGSWQPAAALADGDWTVAGSDMYSGVAGRVGIGDPTPPGKLAVYTDATYAALDVKSQYWNAGRVANFEWVDDATSSSDILQLEAGSGAADDCQFIECERGSVIEFAIDGDGYLDSNAGAEFDGNVTIAGELSVSAYATTVGDFTGDALSSNAHVLSGVSTAVGTGYDPTGVYGESVPGNAYGIGGEFVGGYRGVIGYVYPNTAGVYRGVYGYVDGGAGSRVSGNYAVYGQATNGATNYGVYGIANNGTTNWAGYFNGNTHVTGIFTAGVKSFKIDHPLDPENKYLMHSCVESDDMMNIYNGNVVLDSKGEATVEMPDWFEALNQDFRYQLTAIGAPGPNLYVAGKLSGNAFTIAGGEPGSEVSWQVTGVRHDALAVASRVSVEVDKPTNEVGKYMHPEAHGKPLSMGVDYHEEREVAAETTSVEPAARPVRDRHETE
jgi:hypothetical protein